MKNQESKIFYAVPYFKPLSKSYLIRISFVELVTTIRAILLCVGFFFFVFADQGREPGRNNARRNGYDSDTDKAYYGSEEFPCCCYRVYIAITDRC